VELGVFIVRHGNNVNAKILPEMRLGPEAEDDRLPKRPEYLCSEHHRHFVLQAGAMAEHGGLWVSPLLKNKQKSKPISGEIIRIKFIFVINLRAKIIIILKNQFGCIFKYSISGFRLFTSHIDKY
jgi:hypothetical protein